MSTCCLGISCVHAGAAGVAIYVADAFSPLDARADCLGEEDGDSDIDREGRCARHASVGTLRQCV
jgi:hypothetical protein